ncbi:DUF6292 family protein [Streptomyces niveus]|uniref:DUF6292 family protein n=1 Tax=Streptomyces niveus TaxID=193462 RepID=UPI00362EA309
MADALVEAGVAEPVQVEVRRLVGSLAAAVPLAPTQDAPALVWDERYGWRTATSRRHSIRKDTGSAPEGDCIRYLGSSRTPESADLLEALADRRRGFRQPKR